MKKKEELKQQELFDNVTSRIFRFENEGDEVIGEILNIEDFEGGKYNSSCKKYTMQTEQGIISFLLGSATDRYLEGLDLVGKTLWIVYNGKIELEDGRRVNNFTIKIRKDKR